MLMDSKANAVRVTLTLTHHNDSSYVLAIPIHEAPLCLSVISIHMHALSKICVLYLHTF